MKHLKHITESEDIYHYLGLDIDTIKDIIIELKDAYPSIEGEIQSIDYGYEIVRISLTLDKDTFKNDDPLEKIENYNKFSSLILDVSKRLRDYSKKNVTINNLARLYDDNMWFDKGNRISIDIYEERQTL